VTRKTLIWLAVGVAVIYLLLGALVALRTGTYAPPEEAASAFLAALEKPDLAGIYRYSDLLSAHLAGLLSGANLSEDQKRDLQAQDFVRWTQEVERGQQAEDALRVERALLRRGTAIARVSPARYRAEIRQGVTLNLATYRDVPGQIYHSYFQLSFPEAGAPAVGLLTNVETGLERRIRSVVVRVESRRRPDVHGVRALLFDWDWLDALTGIYPTGWFPAANPAALWMCQLSLDVDKLTLSTY
jgi:hypothetical protein